MCLLQGESLHLMKGTSLPLFPLFPPLILPFPSVLVKAEGCGEIAWWNCNCRLSCVQLITFTAHFICIFTPYSTSAWLFFFFPFSFSLLIWHLEETVCVKGIFPALDEACGVSKNAFLRRLQTFKCEVFLRQFLQSTPACWWWTLGVSWSSPLCLLPLWWWDRRRVFEPLH